MGIVVAEEQVEPEPETRQVHLSASGPIWALVAVLMTTIVSMGGYWLHAVDAQQEETQKQVINLSAEQANGAVRLGRVEERLGALERGLDRIEGKLDRLIESSPARAPATRDHPMTYRSGFGDTTARSGDGPGR